VASVEDGLQGDTGYTFYFGRFGYAGNASGKFFWRGPKALAQGELSDDGPGWSRLDAGVAGMVTKDRTGVEIHAGTTSRALKMTGALNPKIGPDWLRP
jgi:hypothetical protein